MTNSEWMTVNPCRPDCPTKDGHCPPNSRFPCEMRREFDAEVEAQRKLLEYLYKRVSDGDWISATAIKQMLNQLEAK